ncbi:MAG: alpha/beta hydrolase [Ferruginibacter sp.]
MKNTILLLIICMTVKQSFSQSVNGITNQPDTSFTTHSAYISALKEFPGITIVKQTHSKAVQEKYNIVYCKRDKQELLLDVFSPSKKTKEKRTAIVIIFGGGWRSGSRSQHYPLAEKLAGLGYVCFTPDYRLSKEAYFPAAIYDVKASIRWVKENAEKYNVDTAKLAILGFSAGGEIAAFTGNTNGIASFDGDGCNDKPSSWVHAIIDIDGTLSFVHAESGEGDDSKKISAATYWLGYPKAEKPELWKAASPLTYTGRHTPPTLFINSSLDRMHAGRTDYINMLNGFGTYTEIKSFENSPHAFCLFNPWFQPNVQYIDDFLKKVFN